MGPVLSAPGQAAATTAGTSSRSCLPAAGRSALTKLCARSHCASPLHGTRPAAPAVILAGPADGGARIPAESRHAGESRWCRSLPCCCWPRSPCLLYTSDAADEEDSVDLGGGR